MKLSGLGRYAKFATAVAGQALVYAQFTYGADNRWVQLATAAAAAIAVYAVPNAAKAGGPAVLPGPVQNATGGNVTVTPPAGPAA